MSSKILQEGVHDAEFLLSEANGSFSREEINIAAGQPGMNAGTLLMDDGSGNRTPWIAGGSEPITGILYQNVSASDVDQKATEIVRNAEVMRSKLDGYAATADVELIKLKIILR